MQMHHKPNLENNSQHVAPLSRIRFEQQFVLLKVETGRIRTYVFPLSASSKGPSILCK